MFVDRQHLLRLVVPGSQMYISLLVDGQFLLMSILFWLLFIFTRVWDKVQVINAQTCMFVKFEPSRPIPTVQADSAFQHDNAKLTHEELENYSWLVITQASYSPDLAPLVHWLLSHLQRQLDGKKFSAECEIGKVLGYFFKA
ncbi:hypothetical protein OESDEN_12833 [Oesophagostomum dentatum]|uniref:Uncharacterized protein n=1 Tax=Oesophagostomum dentatum TaxID=61180 RepID=A0A0B1SW09_OESDE|nr:hypothetical protein OESDEN_12833 [Oesophagostomum dentatum]